MRRLTILALVLIAACKKEPAQMVNDSVPLTPGSAPWKIASARSAAPPEISAAATINDTPANDTTAGERLEAGSNGWVCYPDDARTPANDPICIDDMGQQWFDAYLQRRPPRLTGMAIAYLLQGGASASDTDPFKMQPDSGQQWIPDGPQIAIAMPNPRQYQGLPTTRRADGPWVKFAGTPYAMIIFPASSSTPAVR